MSKVETVDKKKMLELNVVASNPTAIRVILEARSVLRDSAASSQKAAWELYPELQAIGKRS